MVTVLFALIDLLNPYRTAASATALLMQLDPTPYTAWGVLGALVFVLIVFAGVAWKLFGSISNSFDTRDKTLIEFVNQTHTEAAKERGETTIAMKAIANTVAESNKEVAQALREQSKVLDLVIVTQRVEETMKRRRGDGMPTRDEIEAMVRAVMRDYKDKL